MPEVTGKKLSPKGKLYIYKDIAILNGKRTPFARFNSKYNNITATELGVEVTKKLLKDFPEKANRIDQLIFANTIPSSKDSIFLARHIALKSGLDYNTPASMVQRICASGMEAIIAAANDICLNTSEFAIAGGTENMTRAPLVSFDIRNGYKLGSKPFCDLLWEGLFDTYCNCSMGQTAENIAIKYNISREDVDQFAYQSHTRAICAKNNNVFEDEIVSCAGLTKDETIRDNVELEKLTSLKPAFIENGVQTAGNSSLIADGASAVLLGNTSCGINPAGYLLGAAIVGEVPELMGISPVRAIKSLLSFFDLTIKDIDLWEINEAFGAQYLAVEKLLELDRSRVNVNGGSIAIGHPLAATGVRLIITLLYELRRRNLNLGIASACVGGGQGIAVLVKSTPNSPS